jgi:uncharacterized membrane protein YeiH/ABC-type nitrate/sulfonate/bicarbonate transport system substrate-binding protein
MVSGASIHFGNLDAHVQKVWGSSLKFSMMWKKYVKSQRFDLIIKRIRLSAMKRIVIACLLLAEIFFNVCYSAETPLTELKVQLPWMHSSQFTGLYVAQMRRHFEKEGLKVTLVEGGPNIDPAKELQKGKVDIALVGLVTAWNADNHDQQITNVAQIIHGSSVVLVCRISAGVYEPKDMAGKKIGIFETGDRGIIEEVLNKFSIPKESVEIVVQRPHGLDLVENKVACANALIFDEYISMIEQGVPYNDLLVIDTNKAGVPVLLDGVYVRTNQLQNPDFRKSLIGFLRAYREGWKETRIAPTLSLESVRASTKNYNQAHESKTLESMLTLIPSDTKQFGLLDLNKFDEESSRYLKSDSTFSHENIWTHEIWNQLQKEDGYSTTFSVATKHYLDHFSHLTFFKIFVYFGVFIYALSGVLEAIHRNYDLWGRLVLAFLSGIGGGTLRDLIIGGERLPFYYVKDFHYPLGIFIVVFITSSIVAFYPKADQSLSFKRIKKYSDILGFSALAVAGAVYSINADMPWYWVPALAALTCAGGGALRDIVINQEPHTFKGVIYEESAILGGLFIVCGLVVSNHYEHTSLPVHLTIVMGTLLIISVRIIIEKFEIQYPKFLGGGAKIEH